MTNPNTVNWMELAASTNLVPQYETNLRSVIRFIAGSSTDGLTRCQTAATLVFTLWQVAGKAWSMQPPSLLLIGPPTLDALARQASGFRPEDPAKGRPYISIANPSLEHMRRLAEGWDATFIRTPAAIPTFLATHGEQWRKAKANNFGWGRAGRYSRRWDEKLGLVSDDSGDIILRIETPDDYAKFRLNVLHDPKRLTAPSGRGTKMQPEYKTAAVSGTLTPAQWDHELANTLVNIGMPFHFLPHAAPLRSAPRFLGLIAENFSSKWKHHRANPSDVSRIQPYAGSFAPHLAEIEKQLRSQLHHFPASYEFGILKTFRELPTVCAEIAKFVQQTNDVEEAGALLRDTACLTSLSLLLGVNALAYHGIGFVSGCSQNVLASLLTFVRTAGTTTRREIQRKLQKLDAAELSAVLGTIASKGLVVLDGTRVNAVTWDAYVALLWRNVSDLAPELATPPLVKKWGRPNRSMSH